MEKKTNYFSVVALVALVAVFVLSFFKIGIDTFSVIALILSLVTFIFSIIAIVHAKKIEKGKALPIILLIISILGSLIFGIIVAFMNIAKDPEKTAELCKSVVKCENDGEVSTCYLKEDSTKVLPIKCYTDNLNIEQFGD